MPRAFYGYNKNKKQKQKYYTEHTNTTNQEIPKVSLLSSMLAQLAALDQALYDPTQDAKFKNEILVYMHDLQTIGKFSYDLIRKYNQMVATHNAFQFQFSKNTNNTNNNNNNKINLPIPIPTISQNSSTCTSTPSLPSIEEHHQQQHTQTYNLQNLEILTKILTKNNVHSDGHQNQEDEFHSFLPSLNKILENECPFCKLPVNGKNDQQLFYQLNCCDVMSHLYCIKKYITNNFINLNRNSNNNNHTNKNCPKCKSIISQNCKFEIEQMFLTKSNNTIPTTTIQINTNNNTNNSNNNNSNLINQGWMKSAIIVKSKTSMFKTNNSQKIIPSHLMSNNHRIQNR